MIAPRIDLDELERLHRAATPGPWIGRTGTETTEVSCEETVPVVAWLGFDDGDRKRLAHNMNAALIAAMRNALPALLSIAEAAEVFFNHEDNDDLLCINPGCSAGCTALRAALAAVRKEEKGD